MTDTIFTMDVDNEKETANRNAAPGQQNDGEETFSWSWSQSDTGRRLYQHAHVQQ